MTARIALIGYGAIARELVEHLAPEREAGVVELAGAVVRHPERHPSPPGGFVPIGEAAARDLVVECAGVAAARQHGPALVAAGTALLVTSVGALADAEVARALLGGPGELVLTSGAIGGLDLIRAAAQAGGLDRATITTTKTASSLVQPWMGAAEAARIRGLAEPELLFDGTPAEAIERFPGNVNVAVALGIAARGLGDIADGLARVRVRIVADPRTDTSTHVIGAEGSSGAYRFEIGNRPSRANPRTSALTAQAVAADVRAWLARRGHGAAGP
ncbi:aspartate dehydrogenase domain-containing protein [Agrococcus carbonis]|uniref:L-aspartate dehydrogenase n=1 Tax=Agrococcus carbonis TaxID=684552 RepID=A0A1H1T5D6_9MICO|nr:aspartate dehydrogenase domain-containing protein [Agrococcus carbonis]SDS55400.1 aspartate dehydrogenase [Agrococcus carbonis]